ncbi:MAG: guanylate kinase [Clostridiaceae bacterium]|nr:guanylate kinase [Clostridiaceae bacterium]
MTARNSQMRKGLLFVFSAPSGAGKSTILNRVIEDDPNIQFSVSATTRLPRKSEVDGRDYHFLDRRQFLDNIKNGKMLEYDIYCDNYYGTLKSAVEEPINKGIDIILEITVPGALQVKKMYPDCIMIFICPPSLQELEKRIRRRGTEDEEVIQRRLEQAAKEMAQANLYDYVVINDDLEKAVREIKQLILENRMKRRSESL